MKRVPEPVLYDRPPEPDRYRSKIPYEFEKRRPGAAESPKTVVADEPEAIASPPEPPRPAPKEEEEYSNLRRQLEYERKVNEELKRFLVGSMGNNFYLKLDCVAEEKARLAMHIQQYSERLENAHESREKLAVQCEVWKSKFLASCIVVDEVTTSRLWLLSRFRSAQEALGRLLKEVDDCFERLAETFSILKCLNSLKNPDMRLARDDGYAFDLETLANDCRTMADALRLSIYPSAHRNDSKPLSRRYTDAEVDADKIFRSSLDINDSGCADLLSSIGGQQGALGYAHVIKSCTNCKGSLKLYADKFLNPRLKWFAKMETDPSSGDSASEDEDLRMVKCFEVDTENLDSVDLTCPPKSSEHYLRMVVAERRQLSAVVAADKLTCEQSVAAVQTVFVPKETAVHSSDRKFALSKDRVKKIMDEWTDLQMRIAQAKTVDPDGQRLPRWEDGTAWKQVICHEDGHLKQPKLSLLLSFSASQVHSVFQTIYGWLTADNGEFNEPTLCWFYSLMALMEKPLQPDTYSLLRDFARFCRSYRRDHYDNNAGDKIARGVSMLISIIANYFGQKDLGDDYSDDEVSAQ